MGGERSNDTRQVHNDMIRRKILDYKKIPRPCATTPPPQRLIWTLADD